MKRFPVSIVKVLRVAVMLLLASRVSSCYALAVAGETENESLNNFNTTTARKQSFDQSAELARQEAERCTAETKAALELIRTSRTVELSNAGQAEADIVGEDTQMTGGTWLAIGLLAGVPLALWLAVKWITRRAMRERDQEQARMLKGIRPVTVTVASPPSKKGTPPSKDEKMPLKFILAAEWAERQRQAEEAMRASGGKKLTTTMWEPPPKAVVPLVLRTNG